LIEGDEFCAGFGSDAGGLRIAGVDGHVHDAAALRAICGTHGAFGVGITGRVAVVFRIGVDDAANGTVFRGDLGLDAAPGFAVAGDHDGSLDGDAHGIESLVVSGRAVVHIDEGRGDIAVFGIGVVGG